MILRIYSEFIDPNRFIFNLDRLSDDFRAQSIIRGPLWGEYNTEFEESDITVDELYLMCLVGSPTAFFINR